MQTIGHCPVCAGNRLRVLKHHHFAFPGDDVGNHLLEYRYYALWTLFERVLRSRDDAVFAATLCRDCGFIFTNPRFSEADIATKYETFNELGTPELNHKANPPHHLEGRAQRGFDLVRNHFRPTGDSRPRILDLGGGAGYNLIPFTRGWECGLVDYGTWDFPEGVTKLCDDHRQLGPGEKFQVILLLHTLEHVPEPVPFLQTVADHLAEDGLAYIEVPLGAFGEWRFMTEPIMHLNFFSEQSLVQAARRAGLHVTPVGTRYQWVTHSKLWCVNLIAHRRPPAGDAPAPAPLATSRQMRRLRYYLPYLTNRSVIRKVLRKLTGR